MALLYLADDSRQLSGVENQHLQSTWSSSLVFQRTCLLTLCDRVFRLPLNDSGTLCHRTSRRRHQWPFLKKCLETYPFNCSFPKFPVLPAQRIRHFEHYYHSYFLMTYQSRTPHKGQKCGSTTLMLLLVKWASDHTRAAFTMRQALIRPNPCWWLWDRPALFRVHKAFCLSTCKVGTKQQLMFPLRK